MIEKQLVSHISRVTISLKGNAKDAYSFKIENLGIILRIIRSEHKDITIDSWCYYKKHMQKFKSLISCS
jgi:hypothetical protein